MFIVACILLIISLLVANPNFLYNRPDAIRRELARHGYDVESVDFEFDRDMEGYSGRIFQSYIPLYFNGYYISQWSAVRHQRSFVTPHIRYIYHVAPYPSLPEMVSINITFTIGEFEHVSEHVGSQTIKGYLRQIIMNSASVNEYNLTKPLQILAIFGMIDRTRA